MALISDLPIDVLASILGRLCLRDYIRCRAVCSEWNTVVSCNPNPRQGPWLLLTSTEADEANEICRFYDFYHGVELTVAIPGVRWHHCIGSSDGWLMILDDFSELSMLNPLTGVRIALPSITTFPDVEPVFDSSGRVSHYRINRISNNVFELMTADETGEYYYYKAIVTWTSDSLYTAVVICGRRQRFAFARSGDEAWTLVEMDDNFSFVDVIFYEGRFYAARSNGMVESFDLKGPLPIVSTTVAVDLDPKLACVRRPLVESRYLIEISGNLFEVLRVNYFSSNRRITSFMVYMIDRDTGKWVAVKSLDDYALFLGGDNYSIAVSKRDLHFSALKENCIYFNDSYWGLILQYKDLGVFSLEDGSVKHFYPNGLQRTWPQPIWFVPNLSGTHNV